MSLQIVHETEAEPTNVANVVSRAIMDASDVSTKAELVDEGFFTLVTSLRFFSSVAEAYVSEGDYLIL